MGHAISCGTYDVISSTRRFVQMSQTMSTDDDDILMSPKMFSGPQPYYVFDM